MLTTDKTDCGCETKKVEKACDCGGNCGANKSEKSESLTSRKERLEQELKEVNEKLSKEA